MIKAMERTLRSLKLRGVSDNTLKVYEIHLRHYYSFMKTKKMSYADAKPRHIREYILASSSGDFSSGTVNARLSAVKNLYDFELEREAVSANPVVHSMYIRGMQSGGPLVTVPLSHVEKEIVLDYFSDKPDHVYIGFLVMFSTGLRVSELVALEVSDIETIQGRVTVNVRHGKRGSSRIVPVFDTIAAQLLLEYASVQITDPLFKISVRGFQNQAEAAQDKTGVIFTTHVARHTFATDRLKEGVRIDILQKVMGHKDISTTMLYAKTVDTDVIAAAPKI